MSAPATPPDLSAFSGVKLLRLVATAVIDLSRHTRTPEPVYSDNVQKAYNHVVVQSLLRQRVPPASVTHLAEWAATKPVRDWPLDLPSDVEPVDEYLVDAATRTPTQLCYEWQVPAQDAAAELFENEVVREVFVQCEATGAPATYTAFRQLLVEHPVLTGVQMALLIGEAPELGLVMETIKRCYEPAPAAFRADDGTFTTCERCGCLLKPYGAGWRCELDRCRREQRASPGERINPALTGGVLQLRAPLRMFITGPGLAEIDLQKALARRGLEAQMWPGCDAYDLRITLPNKKVWAIDVKDRANPALLGHTATALRSQPPYDEAYLVVPAYRFADREDYARVFKHYCPPELAARLRLMSDSQFLRHVSRTLARLTAAVSGEDTGA
ncbi:hypothetical protein AB0880_16600 [Micromonospora chersina]|uniref:pPIWI_RE_Y domain-containing protein n=1 Tax=Micromonospora chersina TaxID=47854 RepID=UPI0034549049